MTLLGVGRFDETEERLEARFAGGRRVAFVAGNVGHAEAHDRRTPASLSERRPSWANAHTRAGLAQMLETTLFEGVVVSFEEPHRHDVREALIVAPCCLRGLLLVSDAGP